MTDDRKLAFVGNPDFRMPPANPTFTPNPVQLPGQGPGMFMLGRGLYGMMGPAGLAAGLIMSPTAVGDGTLPDYYRDPRFWDPEFKEIDTWGDGFDVTVPGAETVPEVGFVGLDPGMVNFDTNTNRYLNPGDTPVHTLSPDGRGLQRREAARVRYRLDTMFNRDLIDDLPSTIRPGRIVSRAAQRGLEGQIALLPDARGLRMRVTTRTVDEKFSARPRQSDGKVGGAAYRAALAVFTASYGAATEVQDFLQAFFANTYVLVQGAPAPMSHMRMSYWDAARMLASGKARTDFLGLAWDYGVNQTIDAAVALQSAPIDFARKRAPHWLPAGADMPVGFQDGDGNNVLSQQIGQLSRSLRSLDFTRAARLRVLFS